MPAPTITELPTAPSRSQSPSTFSTDADAFLGALPTFCTEANAQADYLDTLAVDLTTDAETVKAAAAAAVGAANYKGIYSAGTTYQIGQSVSYSGEVYVANTVNTGVTPVDGANWKKVATGNVAGPNTATNNALVIFDGTTGKILKSPIGNGTAGQVLISGGSGVAPSWSSSLPIADYQEFTSSGTWTKPSGATWIYVEAVGGGGGGSNTVANTGNGFGGGGGAFAARLFAASDAGATVTVTVGSGGGGKATGTTGDGASGGNSSFGSLLTARGGQGGGDKKAAGGASSPTDATVASVAWGYTSGSGGFGSISGGSCIFGGAGGGGCNTTTTSAGGTSINAGGFAGTNGGSGNNSAGVKGGNGSSTGSGGGGSINDGGGGDGAAGRLRIWCW